MKFCFQLHLPEFFLQFRPVRIRSLCSHPDQALLDGGAVFPQQLFRLVLRLLIREFIQDPQQLLWLARQLENIVGGPKLHRPLHILAVLKAAEYYELNSGKPFPTHLDQFKSVHAVHFQVCQHHIRQFPLHDLQRLLAIRSLSDYGIAVFFPVQK